VPQELLCDPLRDSVGCLDRRCLLFRRLLGRLFRIKLRSAIVADARLPIRRGAVATGPLTTVGIPCRHARLIGIEPSFLGECLEAGESSHHALAGDMAGQRASAQQLWAS
jgi:hypothetical protein